MPNGISVAFNTQSYQSGSTHEAKSRADGPVPAKAMTAATVALLVNAVTEQLVQIDPGSGRTGVDTPVELRAPNMTVGEARTTLTSILAKLPILLGALLGTQDPLQHEPGAEQRATEGAAGMLPVRIIDGVQQPALNAPATGVDADVASRSANAGYWLASNPLSNLLTLLRQLLLKFEDMERKHGSNMIIVQLETVIEAGKRGVEKAKENLGGQIGATMLMGAVGGYATKKTAESTDLVKKSHVNNMNEGNASNIAVHGSRANLKSTTTPTANHRPARDADGTPVTGGTDANRPDAVLQADMDADLKPMGHGVLDQTSAPHNEALQSDHAFTAAHAQIPASHAMLLNMLGPSLAASVTAGVQIEAEMTEAERQLLLNFAETMKRIADGHLDQQNKTREMREGASDLLDKLQSLVANTGNQIISNF